jgi:hypothetical protein
VTPAAHARWFADVGGAQPAESGFLAEPLTLGMVVSATAMAVAWIAATRRLSAAPLPLGRFADKVPRLLAATLGLSLVALAASGRLLSPGEPLADSPSHAALAAFEAFVGAWLIVGVRLRSAAIAVAVLIAATVLVSGPLHVLESGVVAGIAAYLALAPAGDPRACRNGLRALRLALGGSLVVVAFTEKLAEPALTQAVLDERPSLNLIAAAGLQFGDLRFVGLAGAAEVFLGLAIASGAGAQLIALGALVPFTATVAVFGAPELIGHLPIYGALCALAITASERASGDAAR